MMHSQHSHQRNESLDDLADQGDGKGYVTPGTKCAHCEEYELESKGMIYCSCGRYLHQRCYWASPHRKRFCPMPQAQAPMFF